VRVVAQHRHGEEEEVVEVHGAGGAERGVVARVHRRREHRVVVRPVPPHDAAGHLVRRGARGDHPVLPVGDLEEDLLGVVRVFPLGRNHVHLLGDDAPHELHLVAGGVDGEVLGEADALAVLAEEARPQRVEGGEEDALGLAPHHLRHALAHLQRRLVGEGDGQDAARIDPLAEEVRDAEHQRARLPRAGAGQDQERPVHGQGGALLLGVELAEVVRNLLQRGPAGAGNDGASRGQKIPASPGAVKV
jgi:hypothetical protein